MESQTMGKRIAALRKAKGMTQEQLAEQLGVSAQAVSKWENDVSCPDISILSTLAGLLGVSADELLGAKPIEPRVVVVDSNKEKKGNPGSFSVTYDGGKREGVWFAVALILVGLAFLLSKLNVLPSVAGVTIWSMVWPAVLIGVGVSWFVHDFSPLSLGVAALGLYYLLFHLGAIAYKISWGGVILPAFLVLLGLTILLDKLLPNRKRHGCHGHGASSPGESEYSESNGYINYDCTFGEENRRMESESFAGADIDVSFGKSVLDLTGVREVLPNARIDADVSFGTVELLVPRNIRILVGSDKAFGAVQQHGAPADDAPMSIQLCGDVSFGSLEIRYL